MKRGSFATLSAATTLCVGYGLAIAGFVVPPQGLIDESVLFYTAQTFIYAGSVLGVNVVIDGKISRLRRSGTDEQGARS